MLATHDQKNIIFYFCIFFWSLFCDITIHELISNYPIISTKMQVKRKENFSSISNKKNKNNKNPTQTFINEVGTKIIPKSKAIVTGAHAPTRSMSKGVKAQNEFIKKHPRYANTACLIDCNGHKLYPDCIVNNTLIELKYHENSKLSPHDITQMRKYLRAYNAAEGYVYIINIDGDIISKNLIKSS